MNGFDYSGKTVLVTGGTKGIGRRIAERFLAAGARVFVCGRSAPDTPPSAGGRTAAFVAADVSDAGQASDLIAAAVQTFGGLDILVNNAGIGGGQLRLHEIEPEAFDRVIDVNLRGTFLCTKYALPHFLERHEGRIVNIASTYGLIGAPKAAAY